MAADNYKECPRCKNNLIKIKQDLIDQANKNYGKISAVEYMDLVLEGNEPIQPEKTLREYKEIYLKDTTLYINYQCTCSACNFQFKYDNEIEVFKK